MRTAQFTASVLLFTSFVCAVALSGFTTAEARTCSSAPVPAAISIHGTITEENSTGTFAQTLDLRNGFSKTLRNNGVQHSLDGFNGTEWTFANGIRSVIDVPTLIPISVARAFVARLGWNDPAVRPSRVNRAGATVERFYFLPNMAHVAVISNADLRRPSEATVDGDWGIETTTFSDWRCAGGVNYPFSQIQTDGTGETLIVHASSVSTAQITSETFSPPEPQAHGHITRSEPAAFRYPGKRDRHIIVDATIGASSLPLVFDTGGANYFGPKAAQSLGLSTSGGLTLTGIGGGSTAGGFARVPAMSISNGVLEDEVTIVGELPWHEVPAAPGGLTGYEFLAEFRTTIDFPNQTIAFANFTDPQPSGGTLIPLRTEGHTPIIEASVDGVAGWFGVDTGDATGITIFSHFAKRAGVVADPALPQTTAGGVGGTTQLSRARLHAFSIGGMSVGNARALLSRATKGAFASRSLAGNLGNALFHCFRVTFDYRHRQMILFSNSATPACLQELSS